MADVVTPTVPTQMKRLTYADYRALPDDGKRYELVEGALREVPSPTTSHQRISRLLFQKLDTCVTQERLGEVSYAPLDVHLADDLMYQPDLLFVATASKAKVTGDDVSGPPDLVIEIVSASSRAIDRKEKLANYAKCVVREYWRVYAEAWIVELFGSSGGDFPLLGRYGQGETVRSQVLLGLELPVDAIFEG